MLDEHRTSTAFGSRFSAWRAGLILYLTLSILAFAIPENVVAWIKDRPAPVQDWLLGYAEELERASAEVGADRPYKTARDFFLKLTGKDAD
jgi:hypothetical protein